MLFSTHIPYLEPRVVRGSGDLSNLEELLDQLLLDLWKEEGRDALDQLLPQPVVHVSEITYAEKRSDGIEPAMLHGLECEHGLKCRIREKYGNRVLDPLKPWLLYPEYPVARLVRLPAGGEATLVGNPDFLLYLPEPRVLIPIEKKSGNNSLDRSKKLTTALEQCAVYALMLGSPYCAVQLEHTQLRGGKVHTIEHRVYKVSDAEGLYDEVVNRVECVLDVRSGGGEDYSSCRVKKLSDFLKRA